MIMASRKRRSMSKRTRFAVFDRDGFQCQYCGMQPPSVMLEVDHIIPFSKGGSDDPENLRTSCHVCNSGKAARQLKSGEVTGADSLKRAQEALEQITVAKVVAQSLKARAKMRHRIGAALCDLTGNDRCLKASITTISNAVQEFGADLVFQWIDQSASVVSRNNALPDESNMIRYFCGICKHVRMDADK